MYWDTEAETIDRGGLEKQQVNLLQKTMGLAQQAPYYAELFKKERISPESITSLDDLQRIPFTTKDDLRDQYPYGFLAVSRDRIVRMHSSSGTSGSPTVIFHTMQDIREWSGLIARCMYMTGVRDSDVFQNMTGYGLFTGGLGFHYGAEELGAMVIPVGAGNTKRQIMLMREFDTSVIHVIPSYALYFIKSLQESGIDPRSEFKLRMAYLGAEPHSDETRRRVEAALGVEAFNSYGLSEMNGPGVAFECTEKNGMHIWEDHFLIELVHPKTLEPVKEGEDGEIVFTTLKRKGMPLLRYRSKDIASFIAEPCPCGRTHRRITRIKGRTDDMLIVKGVNMYPVQVEKTLMAIAEVGSNYLIELEHKDFNDHMIVKVEVEGEMFHGDFSELQKLRKTITESLRSELLITPEVDLVEPGSLPRSEGKAVRVIDNRKQWG